jgi:hypothetical protein
MITVIDIVSGFYPRFPPFWTTKTHSDITNAGTLQAVSEYIFRHKMNATSPSTALDDFFGTGMTIVYFLLTSKKKFLHNAYFVDIMVYSTVADLSQVIEKLFIARWGLRCAFSVGGEICLWIAHSS